MPKSAGHLRRLYLRYRTEYFFDEIPWECPVCWSGEVSPKGIAHCSIVDDDGEITFAIHIDPTIRSSPKIYKMVLLHEMAHIKLYPYTGHGRKFDDEMMRLAVAGAFKGLW